VVLIDAGATLDRALAAVGLRVRDVLLVSQADAVSCAASYAMVKALDVRSKGLPVQMVFNRTTPAAAEAAFASIVGGTQRFLGRTLVLGAVLPDDQAIPTMCATTKGSPATVQPDTASDTLASHVHATLERIATGILEPDTGPALAAGGSRHSITN
jgi:MinD-like ATPase involved in chromosome partitioning or flagellar assembly